MAFFFNISNYNHGTAREQCHVKFTWYCSREQCPGELYSPGLQTWEAALNYLSWIGVSIKKKHGSHMKSLLHFDVTKHMFTRWAFKSRSYRVNKYLCVIKKTCIKCLVVVYESVVAVVFQSVFYLKIY